MLIEMFERMFTKVLTMVSTLIIFICAMNIILPKEYIFRGKKKQKTYSWYWSWEKPCFLDDLRLHLGLGKLKHYNSWFVIAKVNTGGDFGHQMTSSLPTLSLLKLSFKKSHSEEMSSCSEIRKAWVDCERPSWKQLVAGVGSLLKQIFLIEPWGSDGF